MKDLEKELDKLYEKDYVSYREQYQMNEDCRNHDCPHYRILTHKGISYYCCNDTYSGQHCVGWHPIYCETLDLCFDYHSK